MKSTIIHVIGLLLISIVAGIVSSGCEKVINLDLKTAASNIVIEGNITNQLGPYKVALTKTASFYDNSPVTNVSGAQVIITDNTGDKDTLTEVSPGIYHTTHIQGYTGRTYNLKVSSEGKEYNSTSTMPDTVGIRYLTYEFRDRNANTGDSSGYRVHCHFLDPVGVKNYYRAQLYKRDTLQNEPNNLTNFEDNLSDGLMVNLTLRGESFNLGDTAKVDLISEDVNVYQYFKVLRSVIDAGGPNSSATPQNPPSNISNGALGYFSAGAVVTVSGVVVQ